MGEKKLLVLAVEYGLVKFLIIFVVLKVTITQYRQHCAIRALYILYSTTSVAMLSCALQEILCGISPLIGLVVNRECWYKIMRVEAGESVLSCLLEEQIPVLLLIVYRQYLGSVACLTSSSASSAFPRSRHPRVALPPT